MEAQNLRDKDYTVEEYIMLLDGSLEKLEYHDGKVVAMAGALGGHNKITMNLTLLLGDNKNGCLPQHSDQAITIPLFNRYIYPDLSFTCQEEKYTDENERFLTNPSLVIEVLSAKTAKKDQGSKFNWYFSLPSVKEYLIVDSLTMDVKSYYRKDDNNWAIQSLWQEDQVLKVITLGEEITLKEIYSRVTLND